MGFFLRNEFCDPYFLFQVIHHVTVVNIWKNCQRLKTFRANVVSNPFSPNSDQHQISPYNINAYSIPEVMRIKDMITQGKFSRYFNNFSTILLKEKYGDKIGEFGP